MTNSEFLQQVIQKLSSVKYTHTQQKVINEVTSTLDYFKKSLSEEKEEREMSKLPTIEISKFTDEELLEEIKQRMDRNIMPTG
jgi:hypothetical protein